MYKFILFITLAFTFAIGGCSSSNDSNTGGGGGGGDPVTPVDPVDPGDAVYSPVVATAADLKNIGLWCDKDFTLANNIIIDEEWQGLCQVGYTGKFDGGGFTVTFNEKVNIGMFARVIGGSVENLNIEANSGIEGAYIENNGAYYAGALAGYVGDNIVIDKCSATVAGNISSISGEKDAYTGGLVGGSSSSINNSYVTVLGDIKATADGEFVHAGGLIGVIDGQINNSFAHISGNIEAENTHGASVAGGLAGSATEITNSFAFVENNISSVDPENSYSGGLAGFIESAITMSFAIAGGDISAHGSDSYAGGVAGVSYAEIINDCVVVIGGDIISDKEYDGIAGSTAEDLRQYANYIYIKFAPGSAIYIARDDLVMPNWWSADPHFSEDVWRLADDYVPMQKAFADLDLFEWPDWVK